MPTAMRALEKSTGKTAKELFKMMEMGQLGAEYILPFTRSLREISNEGGALQKALATLSNAERGLINISKDAGFTIFQSGFSEGLRDLYKTLSNLLENSTPQLEKLGRVFGYVFKGIAHAIKVLEPTLKLFIDNMELIVGTAALYKLAKMQKAVTLFSKATAVGMARAFLPIYAAVAALEEIASFFSDDIVGNFEGAIGHQVNIGDKKVSKIVEKDGKLFKGETVADYSFGKGSYGAAVENRRENLSSDYGLIGKFLNASALGQISTFITGSYDYSTKSEAMSATNKPSTNPVIINNTFNNATADEMMRLQQMQSMMYKSSTK